MDGMGQLAGRAGPILPGRGAARVHPPLWALLQRREARRGTGEGAWPVMRDHPSAEEKLFGAALKPLRERNL